jgi:Fe-S cluster assembly protein SufD
VTVNSAPLALSRETIEELVQRGREPGWLRELRLAAFDAYERLPMPDQRTEGWRRTSLNGLPLADFQVLGQARPSVDAPDGLVFDLWEALRDARLAERLERHFGRVVLPAYDKFTALHYAFFNSALVIVVPRGKAVEEPIWITHDADGALTHILVLVDDEAEARVVEEFRSTSAGLSASVAEQVLGANANLRYVNLQRYSIDTWSFSTQRAELGPDAHLRTLNAALGARLARNTVQVVLNGRNSQADLLGVVALGNRQHVDFQTLQDHFGDGTRSDLVIHDALRDRSSANFTGLIRINKSAHQTASSQEQKNILLSDRAKADSDPKLEILNNDVVRCTHGAAVGPVDSEMLFYLQSRGLDDERAEQLIVEGFFKSVLDKLGDERLRESLWSVIGA